MLGLALVLSPIANLKAAELKILAGGAMTGPLKELGAQFESASGHKLVFRFGTTPEDALKQTLLKAQSIATIPASATGTQVLRVFETLGISEAMKAKTKAQPTPAQVVQVVANGEVELGVFLLNILTVPGLDVVGPFPVELQQEVVFTAAVAADTKEAVAAKAFIIYLTTPAAAAAIKAKGMKPG